MSSEKDISSDEEAYRKFIVVCDESSCDSEKENREENAASKKMKTKKEQFEKMISFTTVNNLDCNEESMDRISFERHWEQLTIDLNKIGPPCRSSTDWRRVWSTYKYNRKRKRSVDNSSKKRNTRREPPSYNVPPIQTSVQPSVPIDTQDGHNVLQEILKQLKVVAQNQSSIIERLDVSNQHLEKIARNQ